MYPGAHAKKNTFDKDNYLPIGRSDYGMTTPGEYSAISLAQVTAIFFSLFPIDDTVIAMRYVNDWIDVIRKEYFETHNEIFPDLEPIEYDSCNENSDD